MKKNKDFRKNKGFKWPTKSCWWYTYPSEKLWVRQLGWWNSNWMESHKIHVPNHQPEVVLWQIFQPQTGGLIWWLLRQPTRVMKPIFGPMMRRSSGTVWKGTPIFSKSSHIIPSYSIHIPCNIALNHHLFDASILLNHHCSWLNHG